MSIIFSPSKTYSGIRAGVAFKNGQGETDDKNLIAWFKAKGYTIEAESKPELKDVPAPEAKKEKSKKKK
jgi:hypothetical protein